MNHDENTVRLTADTTSRNKKNRFERILSYSASNLLKSRDERLSMPKRTYECEYPPCHNIGKLRTLDAFGQGRRLILNLCDEHDEKVRAPLCEKDIIDWLVSIVWP